MTSSALKRKNANAAFLIAAVLALPSCSGRKAADEVKFQQYFAQGEILYAAHCSNCHQQTGAGLGLVYPPVNASDFMEKNTDDVPCLIKYGKRGALLVNGKEFNQPMPGAGELTDLELAELMTYIYNHWGRSAGIIEVPRVLKALERCPH